KPGDDRMRLFPLAFLGRKLSLPGLSDPVVLGLAVVLRNAPFGFDGALLFQLQQHWIECPVIDRKQVPAGLLNSPSDAVAMQRPQSIERLQYHQGKGSLPDVRFFFHVLWVPQM